MNYKIKQTIYTMLIFSLVIMSIINLYNGNNQNSIDCLILAYLANITSLLDKK